MPGELVPAGAAIPTLDWRNSSKFRTAATHGLRDQIVRSQRDAALLQERLRETPWCRTGTGSPPTMGLVDGALESAGETRMVAMLREAMAVIGQDATLTSVGVTTDEAACVTVIEARPLPHAVGPGWAGLHEQAARAGASIIIDPRSWRRSVRLAPASDHHGCHQRAGRLG